MSTILLSFDDVSDNVFVHFDPFLPPILRRSRAGLAGT